MRQPVEKKQRRPSTHVAIEGLRVVGNRVGGINRRHVRALAETPDRWPPILVDRSSLTVIDGAHRVYAARELSHETIHCEFFSGASDEVQLEFLRRNTGHGLALTLSDRKHAAAALLRSHPDWSDRRIAELCGLSPHTVGAARSEQRPTTGHDRPCEQDARLDSRIGRDGRVRPRNAAALRTKIAAEFTARPNGSLREIASAAGASPETVRSVKREIENRSRLFQLPGKESVASTGDWSGDAALRSMDDGEFLEWFKRTDVREPHIVCAERVPLSRVYEVAQEARRRADLWREFAETVESRVRRDRLAAM